jgi:hypothetical protein
LPAYAGDKIYQWTDAKNVRHFSNNPPPGSTNYTERTLEPRVHTTGNPSENYLQLLPQGGGPGGPAKIEIAKQNLVRVSPTVQRLMGEVKNSGTGTASDVRILVTIKDPAQGHECMRTEIPVNPAAIAAGATGSFDGTLEHTCLMIDPPGIEVVASWNSPFEPLDTEAAPEEEGVY